MKCFIKGEYVNLESFNGFYWRDGNMVLYVTVHQAYSGFGEKTIRMTHEEYNLTVLKMGNVFGMSRF